MDAAAHGLVGEMGRLLVRVGDEADVAPRILGLHEEARGFEENGHSRNVVVCSECSWSRVIVGT